MVEVCASGKLRSIGTMEDVTAAGSVGHLDVKGGTVTRAVGSV